MIFVDTSFLTALALPRDGLHQRALQWGFTVIKTVVIEASHAWIEAGLKLHAARADKEWSFTDCISFEVMVASSISKALTHDHHFEQAGFQALLRHDPPN